MIKLNVQFSKNIAPIGQPQVSKVVEALDRQLKPEDTLIGVRIVAADEVRRINNKYAGKDESTDVLSFNYAEGPSSPKDERAGDVVISIDHVRDQAKKAGTDEETELALLIIHGVLHVLGYDHQDGEQQGKLDKLQADIMTSAGLIYRDFNWQS